MGVKDDKPIKYIDPVMLGISYGHICSERAIYKDSWRLQNLFLVGLTTISLKGFTSTLNKVLI